MKQASFYNFYNTGILFAVKHKKYIFMQKKYVKDSKMINS